ncbi:MAG: hypothetical protein HQM02_03335 [Magnetococcales bacterium]|nr:hypothetical protein [Magnetococcales bacterium]
MFKKMQLSSHLLLVLLFVVAGALLMGSLSLRATQRLEERIAQLDAQDFPLILAVSEAARQQMDQVLRMNEVLLYAQVDDRQNFEIANEGYIHAGKRLTNVLIEARHITQKGLESPQSDAGRNHLERIKSAMGELEKIHGSFEHLAGSIIRGQFKFRFLTKAGIITGNATQSQSEAEKEYQEELSRNLSSLDDETKRLDGKLKEVFYLTKELLRALGDQAAREGGIAWIVFVGCMLVLMVGGALLILAVDRVHGARSLALLNTIRRLAIPFREKADSLQKTAQRLDHALNHLADTTRQLADRVRHSETALTTLGTLTGAATRATAETRALVDENAHRLDETERSVQRFGEVAVRALELGEQIQKGVHHLSGFTMRVSLLATSASAEATRGEPRRGFTVFTDEIKELSQKSLHAVEGVTERTESQVKDLQSGFAGVEKARKCLREIADAAVRLKGAAESVVSTSHHQSELVASLHGDTVLLHELFTDHSRLLQDNAGACRVFREQTEAIAGVLQEITTLMEDRRDSGDRRAAGEAPLPADTRKPFSGGELKVEGGVLTLDRKGASESR